LRDTPAALCQVCAVVPEGCEQLVVRSNATLDEVVKDACPNAAGECLSVLLSVCMPFRVHALHAGAVV
jgi:hypothetical protein